MTNWPESNKVYVDMAEMSFQQRKMSKRSLNMSRNFQTLAWNTRIRPSRDYMTCVQLKTQDEKSFTMEVIANVEHEKLKAGGSQE